MPQTLADRGACRDRALPPLWRDLRDRKLANVARTSAAVVATGNIGCMSQLRAGTSTPVVHTVELLDWATGGPRPPGLRHFKTPPKSKAASIGGNERD